MQKNSRIFLIAFAIFFLSNFNTIFAQTENDDETLYQEIARMDSILFTSFNNGDIETAKKIFAKELEFFHDTAGLTNYDQTINGLQSLFQRNDGLNRRLVAGSMEVFPIKDYGAIQLGKHTFCHQENGKDDCGTFRFLHIWQKIDGEWRVTRVVSYDH